MRKPSRRLTYEDHRKVGKRVSTELPARLYGAAGRRVTDLFSYNAGSLPILDHLKMKRTYPDWGSGLARWLAWGAALWIVITTLYLVIISYTAVPFDDEWLDNNALIDPGMLAYQYNEHKLLLARIFLWIDQEIFHYTRIFPIVCILLIQLCHALVLSRLYTKNQGIADKAFAIPVALSFLLWAYQWENFVWAYQIQFVLVGALASMAFACLVWNRDGIWPYGLAAMFAAGSAYSMANGLLAIWLVLSLAIVTRKKLAGIIFLLIVAIGITILYLHDYRHADTTDYNNIPDNISKILGGAAHYIGKPLATLFPTSWQEIYGYFYYDILSLGIGMGGIVCVLAILCIFWRRRNAMPDEYWALLHVLLFVGASSLLTAIGRADTGVSRYGTPVLAAWLALWFLWDSLFRPTSPLRQWRVVLSILPILAMVIAMSFQQTDYITDARKRINRIKHYETALLAGVDDAELLVYMGANYTWPYFSPIFSLWKTQHKGIYAAEWAHWLGKKLPGKEISETATCPAGTLTTLQPVPIDTFSGYQGAWRIHGLIEKNAALNYRMILLDDDGIVAGYGFVESTPVIGLQPQPPFQWYGHVGLTHSTALHAYALDADDNFCLIASSGPVDIQDGIHLVTRGDSLTGEAIPMNTAVLSGWKPLPPQRDPHWHVALPGNGYSTHAALLNNGIAVEDIGGDFSWTSKTIGQADHFILPFYVGYERSRLSVTVVDPDTGKAFAALPNLSIFTHMRWHYWVVPIPAGRNITRFEIRASDDSIGINAHQGISISNPLWMRLQ